MGIRPEYADLAARAGKYAAGRELAIKSLLGRGVNGAVFSTSAPTAIKVFRYEQFYLRELGCYKRLQEFGVEAVAGHEVPALLGEDDALLVIEMTIVKPPYVLDFAAAYLDEPPSWPQDVLDDWRLERMQVFSSEQWQTVERIIKELEIAYGIYLTDVHPGNIALG